MADSVSEGASEQPGSSDGRNLPVAIAVGLLLAGMLIGSVIWDPLAFTVVVGGLAAVGIVETSRTFQRLGIPVATPVLLVAMVALLAGAYRAGSAGQAVGVLVLFAGALAWELAAHERQDVVRSLAATSFLGLWICFLASYAVLLMVRVQDGATAVLAVAGGAVVGDIGGYLFGSLLGRHPIAPSISPKKTWEGFVGGVALAAAVAWAVLPRIGDLFTDPLDAVIVVSVVAIAGFFGDLAESMVKRDLGVKDLGEVLPGHGGILDRVDGVLVALPVGYYTVVLVT